VGAANAGDTSPLVETTEAKRVAFTATGGAREFQKQLVETKAQGEPAASEHNKIIDEHDEIDHELWSTKSDFDQLKRI